MTWKMIYIVTPVRSGIKTHLVYAIVIDQGQLYTDLTGRFHVRSSKVNYVKPVPIKSRSVSEWLEACGGTHQELTSRGFKPQLQTLDNEAPVALKKYL
jgi:hypothetical protein